MSDFTGTDPCWIPSIPVDVEQKWRLRTAQFGDGYQQRILDGINALDRRWNVTFDVRASDVILAMDAYLIAQQGGAFPFLDPVSGVTYSVFCDDWSITWLIRRKKDPVTLKYQDNGTLKAQFVRANGVGIGAIS